MSRLDQFVASYRPFADRLGEHPLYAALTSERHVARFTQSHVFAVWDFMCLAKWLQQRLTCTNTMFHPVGDAQVRRLVNHIIADEESDQLPDGRCLSHLELYWEAMEAMGADTQPSRSLVGAAAAGTFWSNLRESGLLTPAADRFVTETFRFIGSNKLHVVAAAFTAGRENAIPAMFTGLIAKMSASAAALTTFRLYLDRHVELDGGDHGPAALRMVELLCGDDETRWVEAANAAQRALIARLRFWDDILEEELHVA